MYYFLFKFRHHDVYFTNLFEQLLNHTKLKAFVMRSVEVRYHPSVRQLESMTSREGYLEELKNLLSRSYRLVRDERYKVVYRMQAELLAAIREYLDSRGFVELLPPIIGPVTDPGIRGAKQVTVDFYGSEYKVMSSAILYKQMMATTLGKIYFASPNVRLEPPETVYTGRHLVEFVQVDVEVAGADYRDAMNLAEELLCHVIKRVREERYMELELLGRELPAFSPPFKRYTHAEAVDILRNLGFKTSRSTEIPWEGEKILSGLHDEPFFIYNYPRGARGFYDREDPEKPGILRDFDMLYPEGFGEAISGAEREYTSEKVLERMRETGENPVKYKWYLEMLRDGVEPSAGFGIGVERLTRFVCGLEAVWMARPYPKLPGIYSP